MTQRWLWLFVLAMTAWSGSTFILDGSVVVGVALLVVGIAFAWWLSPWKGGRSARHREVLARPSDQRQVVIYWRPGCPSARG